MNNLNFVHLHLHTKYSIKDSIIKIDELAEKLKNNNMSACAITDHGKMVGVVDFYNTMKKNNIKPIIGYESYTAPNMEHLVLLAKTNKGYENLLKICKHENVDNFFKAGRFAKNKLDLEWVKKNNLGTGIIATTACLGGATAKHILNKEFNLAENFILFLQSTFEDVYLELQANEMEEQHVVNNYLVQLSSKLNIPLIITNDCHYLNQEDWDSHDIMLAIRDNKKFDEERMHFSGGHDYYVTTPNEMLDYVTKHNLPVSAISNTIEIANKCNVYLFDDEKNNATGIYRGSLFPNYTDIPTGYTTESFLKKLAMEGLIDYFKKNNCRERINTFEYIERMNYELDIINQMGYADYFLILWDFMNFCKNYRDSTHPKGIGRGPGRGSGVGSLICMSLGITKIDPIKFGLLFERFLNPERASCPDVDTDIADTDRPIVIEYLMKRYGIDRVGQIITFGTFRVSGGVRTLMRLKGYDKKEQDEVCKFVSDQFPDNSPTDYNTLIDLSVNPEKYKDRFADKLESAISMSKDFIKVIKEHSWMNNHLKKLEDCMLNFSAHAGGVLLFPSSSDNYVPSNKATGSAVVNVSQFDMGIVEQLRLLKIDVLGLITTRIIYNTSLRVGLDIDTIDYNDQKVFDMLRNGFTSDVFQFSSPGMTKALIDIRVKSIDDLIACVSLYRPGPLDSKDEDTGLTIFETYIKCCKENQKYIISPKLDGLFDDSMGLPIYQESIMKFVMHVAGCSYGYADIVRRAISKKKRKLMEQIGVEFKYGKKDKNGNYILKNDGTPVIIGGINNGYTEEELDRFWKIIKMYCGYSFNKSHATAYAVTAYQTAYLKFYYPAEFMAEVLTSKTEQKKIIPCIKECKRLGVPVLQPLVSKSLSGYNVEILQDGRHAIRFGLQSIKIVKDATSIVKIQPIKSIDDFFERVNKTNINKGKSENLILAGAFDDFEPNRHKLYNYYFSKIRKDKPVSLKEYNSLKEEKKHSTYYVPKEENMFDDDIKLKYEKELIGLFVSGHPLEKYPYKPWSLITNYEHVDQIGIIKNSRINQDRYGRAYAFFKLECLEDVRDCVLWANDFAKYGDKISDDKIVRIKGTKRMNVKGDQFVANQITNVKKSSNATKNNKINLQPEIIMPTVDIGSIF